MNTAVARSIPWVGKITPKSIAEKLGIDLLNLQRPVESRVLYDLFGTIVSCKVIPDRSGQGRADSVRFEGEFQAADPETGEAIAESARTFIPIMDKALQSALLNGKEHDPKARVAIGLRVAIVTAPKDKPSATGYEFDVQRIIPQERRPEDPIEQLKALARAHALALQGPKQAAPGQGQEGSAAVNKRRA